MTHTEILLEAYKQALKTTEKASLVSTEMLDDLSFICRCKKNKAGIRLVLSCALAVAENPKYKATEPYTEIGTTTCFSGRVIDERYVEPFILKYRLPANATTAYLTPTLRNRNTPFVVGERLEGTPRELYDRTTRVLVGIGSDQSIARSTLIEMLRILVEIREESDERQRMLLDRVRKATKGGVPLSSEGIVLLLSEHLVQPNSSRLPVLMVAAAYLTSTAELRESILPLKAHNAADRQTQAIGDVEVCLIDSEQVVTAYEMKLKVVTAEDIAKAVQKITAMETRLDNYLFVTTEAIDPEVAAYAESMYQVTGGIEIAILDCLTFVRQYLHLFPRVRGTYLDKYQHLLLNEPDSSVSQELKSWFLETRAIRQQELSKT